MPQKQGGYLLPPTPDDDRLCFRVSVPNNRESIGAFLGQLAELGYWYNWQRDSGHSAIAVSHTWRDILQDVSVNLEAGNFFAGDCTMDFCDEVNTCPPNIRLGANGGIEWFDPSCMCWVSLPGSGADPRTDGTVDPPWPAPPSGQTGNCLGAANIVAMFKQYNDGAIAELTVSGSALAIMGGFIPFLDLVFLPIGIIATVALELASAYTLYSASTLTAAFTSTVYDEIRCIIDCHIDADGKISAGQLADITHAIDAIDPTVATIWDAYANLNGVNGMMKQERLAGIVSFDCSTCDCGWCYESDFSAGDFSIWNIGVGNYVPGLGVRNIPTGPYPGTVDMNIGSAPAGLTRVELYYDKVGVGGSGFVSCYTIPSFTFVPNPGPIGTFGTNLYLNCFPIVTAGQTDVKIQVSSPVGADTNVIRKVRIHGTGTPPFGTPNC